MFGHRARLKLRSVTQVVTRASGGLLTRIDENRALLQLLLSDASRLLAKNPQVVTYLRSHDQFFVELQRTLGLVDPPEVIVARNVDGVPTALAGVERRRCLSVEAPNAGDIDGLGFRRRDRFGSDPPGHLCDWREDGSL